ncbi:MAG: STAS domain-containing protein [Burkholderiales bacterium]|nr:STAS domain-containing protein [Bacteroidia bacterium]
METEIETKIKQTELIKKEDKASEPLPIKGHILDDKLEKESELAGVLCKGVQYYDFRNIPFISNTGLASLIKILKASLKQGIKLKFVNVNKRIKQKIQTMGLDKFINCS